MDNIDAQIPKSQVSHKRKPWFPNTPGHKNRKSGVMVRGKGNLADIDERMKWARKELGLEEKND